MVALADVPQVIRIDFHHSEGLDPGLQNRSFWSYTSNAPAIADMNQLASDVSGFWGADFSGLAGTNVTLTEVVCTDLTSSTAARGSHAPNLAGTRAGAELPDNCCTLLNFQVSRRYRGGKPRMYAPWGTAADLLDSDHWTPAFVTAVNNAWSTFAANLNGHVVGATQIRVQQNVSYYSGLNLPPVTLPSGRVKNSSKARTTTTPDLIVSHTCNSIVGSQRRRLRV
jgi:hypothetical protein